MNFQLDENDLSDLLSAKGSTRVALRALEKECFSLEEFISLLTCEDDPTLLEKMAARAQSITRMRFGRVKGLYIPLYLSSACHNACTYCGFSRKNRIRRKTLELHEIKVELTGIYEKGFRNILLVSGELEGFKNISYLAEAVQMAKRVGFHSISVELGALDAASAGTLTKAGAQSFVLYQETYHKETYRKVHPEGQKSDYDFRMGGAERAIDAGFRQVTLGFLVGLYDPIFEALALYRHLAFLKKKYWGIEFTLSLPRLRNAAGIEHGFHRFPDGKYARILMAFRLAFPEVAMNLSTRESAHFRDGMANICVTHLSVESKTHPGGYVANDKGELLEQFSVHDNRSLPEITAVLNRMGYDVHFKDWEMELNRI